MKPIVVVGGTSFIGRHLLVRLASHRPLVATYHRSHDLPSLPAVEWVASDLAGDAATAGWPAECDTVVYLAQSRAWRRFPDGAADVFDVNVRGVFRAAEYARAAGARRFVFASTGSVYNGTGPARETDPVTVAGPRQFYVAAKLSAELLLGACATHMAVIVLRLFVPYGAGQNQAMLIPQLIEKVRRGDPILLDGTDGLRANPVAAADVAETIERCLALDESATLNVAGPEVLSLREIGTTIGQLLGREPVFAHRSGSPACIVGEVEQLSARLGWTPPSTMAAGLRESLSPAANGVYGR